MSTWIKRNHSINSISELVCKNTGMTIEQLKNDSRTYKYAGIEDAVDLMEDAISAGKRIAVHGDYDTDGVMSLSIFTLLFRAMRIHDAILFAPCRFIDGYGLKPSHVDHYHDEGIGLLICVDNGIAAIPAIEKAKEYGMDVIILDHHEPFVQDGHIVFPEADVLVDPHIKSMEYDFDDLCGASLAYYFAKTTLRRKYRIGELSKEDLSDCLLKMTSFAAIATVGDVVSLRDDNRRIVKKGLQAINNGHVTAGLRVLLEEANVQRVDSMTCGFTLSPIVNASGRLCEKGAQFVLETLTTEKESSSLHKRVKTLIARNEERKARTKESFTEAMSAMQGHEEDPFLVIVLPTCPSGLVGLVAGKLTEQYQRPSIVLSKVGDYLKGSGRSTESFDIKASLDNCANLLSAYGGHSAACGVTLPKENVEKLRSALCKQAPKETESNTNTTYYDLEGDFIALQDLVAEQDLFAPFGAGNPQPVFLFRNVQVAKLSFMGADKSHAKFITKDKISIVWFSEAERAKEMSKAIDVLATLSLNYWNGKVTPQLQAIDVQDAT